MSHKKLMELAERLTDARNNGCQSCVFFEAHDTDRGLCKINPPKRGKTTADSFPTVDMADWCGQWQHNPDKPLGFVEPVGEPSGSDGAPDA